MTTRPYQTKTEWVYEQLRSMVAKGEFAPGEHLRLGELASRFETSEMPVREAMRMLQRDGLVEVESHRGATVVPVRWDEVLQTISVRTQLEVLAVEEATPHHTGASVAKLRKAMAKMDEAEQAGDGPGYSEANRAFHLLLYAPGRNDVLKATIEQLWDRLWQTRTLSLFTLMPMQMTEAQKDHEALVEMLAAGDGRKAGSVMAKHRLHTLAGWEKAVAKATASESDSDG
jgi:DNA-binding GntR family transcriptional regulator